MSTNFTRKAVLTSGFSHEHSVSLNITASLKVGGAIFAGGSISTTTSDAHTLEILQIYITFAKKETLELLRSFV